MDASWMQIAGKATVFLYAFVVLTTLTAYGLRLALRKEAPGSDEEGARPPRPATHRLLEWVGNTSVDEPGGSNVGDRRGNWQARILMDHLKREALARQASPHEVEEIVEQLRRAMRAEGPGPPDSAIE